MTDDDKKRIAEYIGWTKYPPECMGETVFIRDETHGDVRWDANDAALCVQEMQKRGDWEYFVGDIEDTLNFFAATYKRYHKEHHSYKAVLVAWLFNAENFFTAMSQWLKERK